MSNPAGASQVILPDVPAAVAGVRATAWLTPDGEIESLSPREATNRLRPEAPPMVCHAGVFFRRLGARPFQVFDVLELFAFARPAEFVLPTPGGLAQALSLPLPRGPEKEAMSLVDSARALLAGLSRDGDAKQARAIAWAMQRGGWPWAGVVLAALGGGSDAPHSGGLAQGLAIWSRLGEWDERPMETAPRDMPVEAVEARAQLVRLLGPGAEKRPEQAEYAGFVASAFRAREQEGEPHVVLADAGTGVGKTLGYIAPASVWAEKNQGTVWVSTFTRNLQRQLDGELDRLYPVPEAKAEKVVIRKGRENYFCILNFAEAVGHLKTAGNAAAGDAVALGLLARWALATRDGDMVGGDFPSWLTDLLGRTLTTDLTDTRGECTYGACEHYGRCFVERTIRRARHARIVVANHALVMIQAALGGVDGDDGGRPLRYVFDEGHHIFSAADGAFSADLTGAEAEDLRRWIVGAEAGRRSRSRGLKARIEDMIAGDDVAMTALDNALRAARALPGPGWRQRLAGEPVGAGEAFLAHVRTQVLARDSFAGGTYSLEAGTGEPVPGLLEAAGALEAALTRLREPLGELVVHLARLFDVEADTLATSERNRIEAVIRGLRRRGVDQLTAWVSMLRCLSRGSAPEFVDWFGLERIDGREVDVGLHRHFLDPTKPFAEQVLLPAHGVVMTSATLIDDDGSQGAGDGPPWEEADKVLPPTHGWPGAMARTGAIHLARPPQMLKVQSPFDYPGRTRVLVVGDVDKSDSLQVAAAIRELFLASGGGGIGLFTAISRLRQVYGHIAAPLDAAGIPLLAQHIDGLDTGTLIDIFRAEENACLLGTDAVRDGVDVPGRSLRLIVFDRVPWPRPDLLHRARREAFGGRAYDEMLTRLRLKQAYGRLLRKDTDRGVFVMLDRALPSRLLGAFPAGVEARRLGLKDAISEVRAFLASENG